MPFCKKCGNELEPDAAFCPDCGTPVSDTKSSKQKVEETTDDFKTQVRGKAPSYGVLNLENLPKGHVIDERYEIKKKLGQGGFGAVYLAYDRDMNIDKALKIIPEEVVNDKEAMFDLQQEAQTMISLNHPNIVRVYDFHRTGNIKYIDMEYIDGKTLTEIKLEYPNKQIPEEEVKEYAIKIAEGLTYAHSNNVIHKDIKPQNVMVTTKGEVKIMDFGIAETVRSSMSRIQNTSSSGTLVYMSPEQLKGKHVGKESDIYSFGVVLYELLSGHPPFFKGDINYQILNEEPEPLGIVSEKMNYLLLMCLKKDYRERCSQIENIKKYLIEENITENEYNIELLKAGKCGNENLNQIDITKEKRKKKNPVIGKRKLAIACIALSAAWIALIGNFLKETFIWGGMGFGAFIALIFISIILIKKYRYLGDSFSIYWVGMNLLILILLGDIFSFGIKIGSIIWCGSGLYLLKTKIKTMTKFEKVVYISGTIISILIFIFDCVQNYNGYEFYLYWWL